MKKILIYIVLVAAALSACVKNDLPYPIVVPNITSMTVDGAEKVEIDYDNNIVTIHIPETSDMRVVKIDSVKIDQEIATTSIELVGNHDLTRPKKFIVSTYQDYEWTIRCVRNVERYFSVKGQIGTSVIDEFNRRAVAMVGKDDKVSDVTVTSLKLGPEGLTTYSLPISQMKDFTHGIKVDITAFDQTETWELYVERTDLTIGVQSVNAFARKAYVTSIGVAGVENSFQYRKKGTEEWIQVDRSNISSDGGTYVALIEGLDPMSLYEVVAISDGEMTTIHEFTTEAATPVPNGSFEYASLVAGSSYYKFYDPNSGVEDASYMFWGSGNGEGSEGVNGSASMGIVITYIDTQEKVDGNQSVRAQTSQLAGILAAGNLFVGQFAGLVGTSGGMVNFGRPWISRPTSMIIYCKYETGQMDIIGKTLPPGISLSNSDYDCAEIKFAIGTWDHKKYGGTPESPIHVNTTDSKTFVDFSTDDSTIANGSLVIAHDGYVLNGAEKISIDTNAWIKYEIPLNYKQLDGIPTHLIISCAASRYGDYFTGCSRSKLWIDAVEFVY